MKFYFRLWTSAFVLSAVALSSICFLHERISAQVNQQSVVFRTREEAYRANNRGVALLEQFNHKEAAEAFRQALSLDPNLKIARVNFAIALFNLPDYENSRTEAQKAAESAPDFPQSFYILGLIARTQNRTDDAVSAFKRVLAIDATDVGANINLGQIYMQQRQYDDAAAAFRVAIAAEPYNSTALYNLATALLRAGKREEGQQLMTRFQSLRQSGAATSIGQNYLEQGRYAEAIVSTGVESELVDKTTPNVFFQNSNSNLPVQKPQIGMFSSESYLKHKSKVEILQRYARGAALFDFDNDGDLDLAKLNNSIAAIRKISRQELTGNVTGSISLYRNDTGKFVDVTRTSGDLALTVKNVSTGVVAGDFDNDGLADLFINGYEKLRLLRNLGKGKFEDVSEKAKLPKYPYLSISSAFFDADHDGDLDIFIAGFTDIEIEEDSKGEELLFPLEFPPAPNWLLRNNGNGAFVEIGNEANLNSSKTKNENFQSEGNSIAVIPTDFDNRRDLDLLILNYNGKPNLFRNLRDGSFRDVAGEVGLTQSANWSCAAIGDFNKDGFVDFFFGKSGAAGVFAVSDGRGKFVLKDAPKGTENAASAQFVDFDNDGLLDLIVNTDKGFAAARNLGDSWTNADWSAFKIKTAAGSVALESSRFLLTGDIDTDGDEDLLTFAKNGNLSLVKNIGGNSNNAEIVRLQGRASNRTGIGAKVDLRAGSLSQKLESYSASPMPAPSNIHFGLGKREKPDAVRVIWTSGVVQAEIDFRAAPENRTAKNNQPLKIEELDRKPSSCPYLYAWNGERFEFITDFLGGGEMGNWAAAGAYHYPDSDEFVRIAPDKLKPKNGRYEIRVTNELEEVLFVDKVKLIAVEHDADREVYPNEGLGIPTAGKRILYTTQNAREPRAAVNSGGGDVLSAVSELDRKFYDSFKSLNIRGYAAPHSLTLKLDDKKNYQGRTLLLLTGWTDYAFSSDNVAASQSGKSLFLPKLQVKNEKGEWQTVIDSIGISVGRPQTVVVDLTGKFLTDSREVRIVTNFKTYWDKIAVDTSEQAEVKITEMLPIRADLRERGFSEEIKYGEMIAANYNTVLHDGRWKYFSGNFTRLGDVKPLLEQIDDVFVISKTGDEIVLSFPALPEPPEGKKYTFLLYADGYSKEMDINSGSPDTVLPLPFKAMKKYPYNADEQFPMTEEKRRIYEEYTTRTVKNALPRIEASLLK
ncbi:MAG TPA: FG-GAP-like repeat-containing protein [Pyrinomonadaceae bacterium]|jgi:Flp pilus assembly protein TadD